MRVRIEMEVELYNEQTEATEDEIREYLGHAFGYNGCSIENPLYKDDCEYDVTEFDIDA